MNKYVMELYEEALNVVLDDYGLTPSVMFGTNDAECVQARMALIEGLHDLGLTDREIAECTQKMRRCSVCAVRNKYNESTAPWTVKMCIEKIKGLKKGK